MQDNLSKDLENLNRYVGHMITIYTTSGGHEGAGFTGILMSANTEFIRLLANVGKAPDIHSPYHYSRYDNSHFGTIVVIPNNKIVSFIHNII